MQRNIAIFTHYRGLQTTQLVAEVVIARHNSVSFPLSVMNYTFYLSLSVALAASITGASAQEASPPATTLRTPHLTKPSFLRVSLGVTSTLNWEYTCPRLAIEYAPMLTRHLGVAARLVGVAGKPSTSSALYGPWIAEIPNQNYRAGFLEAEGLLYPFGVSHRVRFAVGLGGYVGRYRSNGFSAAEVQYSHVQSYQLETRQGNAVGYLGSLNLEVALGKKQAWLLGLKATRQQGLGGITNLPSQSLTIARQL